MHPSYPKPDTYVNPLSTGIAPYCHRLNPRANQDTTRGDVMRPIVHTNPANANVLPGRDRRPALDSWRAGLGQIGCRR
jgi:hypothetical protein